MKAEIKTIPDKVFQPFQLVLTVESEEDLAQLWHRFNIGDPFNAGYSARKADGEPPIPDQGSPYDAWFAIDSHWKATQ